MTDLKRALSVPALDALDPSASWRDVLRASLAAGLARLFRADPEIRADANPEPIHVARTTVRRMRSVLQTFSPLVERKWGERLTSHLRWFGGELGAARDSHVLLERVERQVALLSIEDARETRPIVDAYASEEAMTRLRLQAVLREPRYLALLEAVVDAVNHPHAASPASVRALDCMPSLMQSVFRQLQERVDASRPAPTDRELHRIRIKAKRARYAAEAFASVAGSAAREFAGDMQGLQDLLGEQHDAAVNRDRLRGFCDEGKTGLVARLLCELEDMASEAARRKWRAKWVHAAKRKRRFWL